MPLFGPPNVGDMEAKGNVKGLIKAMGYKKDADIRRAAAEALVRMGRGQEAADALANPPDARALEPLAVLLKHRKQEVRVAAARPLSWVVRRSRDPRATEFLVSALRDRSPAVRQVAARDLDSLGWRPDRSEAGAAFWAEKHEWDKCVELGAAAVKPLIRALGDKDYSVREAVARALGQIGDARAVKPLIRRLKDKSATVRSAATKALGAIGDPRGVEPLTAALASDSDWYQSVPAVVALGKIGDARAADPLIAVLRRPAATPAHKLASPDLKKAAADALDQLGWEPKRDELGAIYWIAKGECQRCVDIGAPASGPLIEALADERQELREAAAATLEMLGWQPDDGGAGAAYWVARHDWDRCVEIGRSAVEPLIHALKKGSTDVRRDAAIALGDIGDERGVDLLVDLLWNRELYGAAAEALQTMMDGLRPAIKRRLLAQQVTRQGRRAHDGERFHTDHLCAYGHEDHIRLLDDWRY